MFQQPLDFHQQSAPIVSPCPSQMLECSFGVEVPAQALHPNFERHHSNESPLSSSHFYTNNGGGDEDSSSKKALDETKNLQDFLLQKFSSQDFDLLTKNYDFFLQYYKMNCASEQLMDDKHLSMDFLTQFYHLNEFKRKLNGCDFMEQESNISDNENDDNDDVVALLSDSKDDDQQSAADLSKKMGVSSIHNNKRLRTTILPEQLNYLYECYQKESNPSRKQLEEIAKKVNLKKRVVQV